MKQVIGDYAGARILVAGSNADTDSFEWHVHDALGHMGCEVELFHHRRTRKAGDRLPNKVVHKVRQLLLREPERLQESRLFQAIDAFAPSLILVLQGNQMSPKTIASIRRRSRARIVCWCQDALSSLGRQFLIGSGYDAVFVKDRYMQDLFSRMLPSSNFYYLPEACNPRIHRPVNLTDAQLQMYGCDVMIAGTLYYYRQEILRQLDGIELKVWGSRPDWLMDLLPGRFTGHHVHGDEKVRAVLAAKICLNTLHYAEVDGLNCRAFELAGCGGFQMISRVPVLAEHFEPELEIETFASIGELKEKVHYYLHHPLEAKAIADRGRQRAHREHTYEHRLQELLRISLS